MRDDRRPLLRKAFTRCRPSWEILALNMLELVT